MGMMDEMSAFFAPARSFGPMDIIVAILLSFILSLALATVYRWTYQGLSYSRAFVHTMVLGSVAAAIMIMAIGNNLARGLGILGTLAIVRFRTPIRDPRDIIFLFTAFAVGIGSGAGVFSVIICGTISFCVIALYLHWSPFASRREFEGLLRFMFPSNVKPGPEIQAIFKEYCSSAVLIGLREAVQGDVIEYSYQIRLTDPSYQSDFLDAMHKVKDIDEVSMLMQRSTVEI
jgi:hypothetical protein